MRITSLLENTTNRSDMQVEHGLSLYVETENETILFDMGQTGLFCENAAVLGLDLSKVDIAVISHGHYDHGGGLRHFLAVNDHAPVYIHQDAFLPHYNGCEKYIGLDPALVSHPRIVLTGDEYRIRENLVLFSCNHAERRNSFGSFGLTERTESGFIPDDFRHEQYLSIRENGRHILLSGCSHKGILDIAKWFRPDILIGGFHVSKMDLNSTLRDAALSLAGYPTAYYTCHCTGKEQFTFMKEFLPNLNYLACGDTIEI